VKFIVNVRLMENRVKSHVGRVIDTNVINQNKRLGIHFSTVRKAPAASPSRASAAEVAFHAAALVMAADELFDLQGGSRGGHHYTSAAKKTSSSITQ
jgi:hypothetical protein